MLQRIIGVLLPRIMPFIFHSQSKTNSVESMIHLVDGDVLKGENVLIEEGRLTLNSYGQTLIFDISEIEKIDNLNGIQISEDLLVESHFNINLAAHISFGNNIEYNISLDYLRRLNNKNCLGYDSYFKFLSGIGYWLD